MRGLAWCGLASAMCLISTGCTMMHDLQPHRLWRWNRGPAASANPFFSVSDPIPQLGDAAESLDLADVDSEASLGETAAE